MKETLVLFMKSNLSWNLWPCAWTNISKTKSEISMACLLWCWSCNDNWGFCSSISSCFKRFQAFSYTCRAAVLNLSICWLVRLLGMLGIYNSKSVITRYPQMFVTPKCSLSPKSICWKQYSFGFIIIYLFIGPPP